MDKKNKDNQKTIGKEEEEVVGIEPKESPILKTLIKYRCTCPCHRQNGITHITACCNNGYINFI
jgi:hypothetical protein